MIYLNYYAFCISAHSSQTLKKDKELQSDDSSDDRLDTSYYNDKGSGENIFISKTDRNEGTSEMPSTTSTTTTTSTKSSHTTTTTEEPKAKTIGSETEHTELSTISEKSTEEYPTYAPCPPCTTNFALGTFFFGNFFGMALMLVMGYIYLSWLRRTSSIPQSARLY